MRRLVTGLAGLAMALSMALFATADDSEISRLLAEELRSAKETAELKSFRISVKVENGIVWMKGAVSDGEQREKALNIARRVPGVRLVVNDLLDESVDTVPASGILPTSDVTTTAQLPISSGPVMGAAGPVGDAYANNARPRMAPMPAASYSQPMQQQPIPVADNGGQVAQTAMVMNARMAAVQAAAKNQLLEAELANQRLAQEKLQLEAQLERQRAQQAALELAAEQRQMQQNLQQQYQTQLAQSEAAMRAELAQYQQQQLASVRDSVPTITPVNVSSNNSRLVDFCADGSCGGGQSSYGGMISSSAAMGGCCGSCGGGCSGGCASGDCSGYGDGVAGGGYGAGVTYDAAQVPGYAWPSYSAYPNYASLSYPRQYSPQAWPYIGPFYPYPQVPLGWRKVSLEWDDGWWMLDFTSK